ncbi:Predicted transcriptional regulator [Arthrobacter agilis]|uniref:helix-turn-helix transcriptional regulator n=1 Tax=Arthrobacter agilis TaxID=37921 RepID=UPI000F6E9196|nr:helix-turn-helix domain-containing protein [Arthrobacter agilis]VDR33111.1 Predicted transcriptional regulator [Arthrobacter agilis]
MEDRIYTPAELGSKLNKTPASLAQWRYMGMGPKFVKIGRAVRYRESDINAWLDGQTRQRTGDTQVSA